MKTLQTIYKLTEVGNIQQWTMVIDGNGYFSREGIVNGKISENKPTVCEGKNGGKAAPIHATGAIAWRINYD